MIDRPLLPLLLPNNLTVDPLVEAVMEE